MPDVEDEPPDRRPLFIAGSDAHGSFNYSVGLSWDYRRRLLVDDNAIGRVRTAVLMPHPYTNEVPPEGDILAAVKKGSCVVTDGPIIDFSLEHNGILLLPALPSRSRISSRNFIGVKE